MAITIRNKTIEEGVRRLGRLRNEGPSAVIGRLVERELRTMGAEGESREEGIARRRKAMAEWIAALPPLTDEDRKAIDRAMEEMYDENGLPR
jgi:hypothetical protein